jgi:basic amino acid/polyamine antiporter, APA family
VSVIYAYSADFRALTLDATLVIAVTFLGSAVAATILPFYKPEIFNKSAVAHLGLLVSAAGLITAIILGWTVYLWLSDPLYGIGTGNANSIIFLCVVYGAAALVYVIARVVRRSQGIDLDAIHSEIPAE